MSRYVIKGGQEGKDRLKLISEVMRPTTSQLLGTVGLGAGMKCLDVGCGGGHVTLLMASMVGPLGKVIGMDAEAERLYNVEFRHADASAGQEEKAYDVAYARFLLTHLNAPENCLSAMVKACKPDGWVVIEDIDFTGSFCFPYCEAYERYTELYQEVVRRRGGDANIGPRLPGMLRGSGVNGVRVNVVQPTHVEGDGKFIASITMQRISDSVMSERLATEDEVLKLVNGLNDAAEDPETVMSLPRVFQTWGRRA